MSESNLEAVIEECFQNPDDEETLSVFDRALRPHLLAVLVSTYRGDPSLAEDAYQEAFIKYIQIFRTGFKPKNYEAYFVAIAKHCLVDELRRLRHYIPLDEVFEADIAPTIHDEVRKAEARICYLQAMMQLDVRCRFVLERYLIEGMGADQIAKYLEIKSSSVHMIIKRCRDRLKKILR